MPPYEASGTSGMKAAHNGVINFSVLDGWWIEGCVEGLTGWAIGPSPDQAISEEERRKREIADLYNKLEYLIIPKFYQQRDTLDRLDEKFYRQSRILLQYASNDAKVRHGRLSIGISQKKGSEQK